MEFRALRVHNAFVPTASHFRRWFDWGPAWSAAVLAMLLFAVTLRGTYTYDDLYIAHDDPRLHNPEQWGEYWTQGYFQNGVDNLYRPLVSMTYALEAYFHGDRPWVFHLINVLLYGGCAACVAELGRRLGGLRVAYVSGLLFAVHPVHVEVVAGIVGRAELMMLLGVVGGLILFVRRPLTMPRVGAIMACCLLGVLSKEQGMLLPILLLTWAIVRRWQPSHEVSAPSGGPSISPAALAAAAKARLSERQATLWLVLGLSWMLAGYMVFRESFLPLEWDRIFLDWTVNPLIRSAGSDRWLVPLALLGQYARLLLFPLHLSIDYGAAVFGSAVRWNDANIYFGMAAVVAWVALMLWALRRRSAAAVLCLIGLGVSYGMVSNVAVIIGTIFAERLMFLPSVFVVILIALALKGQRRWFVIATTIALVLAGSLRSFTYARHWNDALDLYEYTTRHQPQSVRGYILTASELIRRGRLEDAARVAQAGREVLPSYYDIWRLSAAIALKRNQLDDAERYLNEAFRTAPNPMYLQGLRAEIQKRRDSSQSHPATPVPSTSSAVPAGATLDGASIP